MMASLRLLPALGLPLILLLTGSVAFTVRCPNGFIANQNSCYKFVTMQATWIEAKVMCEMMDAHLAEVESPYEEQFIMNRVFFTQPELQEVPLWIGASDIMNDNEWVWMHSKSRVGYRNWSMNRPEVMEKGHGRCLAMQAGPYFAWVTTGCQETNYFVCEREMYGSPAVPNASYDSAE